MISVLDTVKFPDLGISVNIKDIAFKLGSIDIYWYGIIIATAMLLSVVLAILHAKKNNFPEDLVYDILLVSLPSAIIGARLYYVIFNWSEFKGDLTSVFNTRQGGLAVYGGILGAFLATYIMTRIRKIPFLTCADYCIPYIALGQAIGRWGNFFNQEAYGGQTKLPWGMTSDSIVKEMKLPEGSMVHPTFLYESIVDLTLFFILLKVRKNSKHAFETTAVYMCIYGTFRFIIEGLRTDSLYIGSTNIRTSQILSLILVLAGLIYIAVARLMDIKRQPIPEKFFLAAASRVDVIEEATEEAVEDKAADETSEEIKASDDKDETKEDSDKESSEKAKED